MRAYFRPCARLFGIFLELKTSSVTKFFLWKFARLFVVYEKLHSFYQQSQKCFVFFCLAVSSFVTEVEFRFDILGISHNIFYSSSPELLSCVFQIFGKMTDFVLPPLQSSVLPLCYTCGSKCYIIGFCGLFLIRSQPTKLQRFCQKRASCPILEPETFRVEVAWYIN